MQLLMKRFALCTILIISTVSVAAADTLLMRDGQTIRGTYLGGTARQVRIEVNGEVRNYDVSLVRSVTFSAPAPEAPPQARETYTPPPPPRQAPPPPSQRSAPVAMEGVTIPADTAITVRMIDSVNSETSRLGQTYMASLDEPIVVNGQVAVPRGADVITKLVDDQSAGKLAGRTVLTLALVSMRVNDLPAQWDPKLGIHVT